MLSLNAGHDDPPRRPGATPASTVAAFWYVVSLRDPERFKAWLRDHPPAVLAVESDELGQGSRMLTGERTFSILTRTW